MNEDSRYVFLLGMNLGYFFKARDLNKEHFMEFCKGIWESIEMDADWEKSRDRISDYMQKDIPKHFDQWKKNNQGNKGN